MDQPHRFPVRPPQPAFLHKPMMMNMMPPRPDQKLPSIYYFNLDDPKVEKKWRGPKEDITDYFNYGLTEETWKILVEKVVKLSDKVENFMHPNGECTAVNDRLPLEFGGFGKPYFDQIAKLPFLNILKRNKERFFFQYFQQNRYDVDEAKNQLQNALNSEFIEENFNDVRSTYEDFVPGLLQLKHKLPQITHTTMYRPRPGYGGGPGQPRPSLNPLKDPALASITAGLPRSTAAQKPPENSKFGNPFTAESLKSINALMELAGQHFPQLSNDKRDADARDDYRSRKYSEASHRESEAAAKTKKKYSREERSRTPRKDKKRKDKKSRSRSKSKEDTRKKKKDRKKSKNRSREKSEESREKKKKAKKVHKEKKESESPPPSSAQFNKNDIRQRIQPRANR